MMPAMKLAKPVAAPLLLSLASAGCIAPGETLALNDNRVVKIDRRIEKPEVERCKKYQSDASLSGPCEKAKVDATNYFKSLETSGEVCLENTLGEPLNDCYARGRVVDVGTKSVVVSVTEVDAARAKGFRKTGNVYFDLDGFIDLYLSEHGY
jgi:hypothetical protein